jgi:serine/threonine protein kinase
MRYRILRPHAKGSLGEVLVAEDVELHREAALKEIQPDHAHDAVSRGRFLLETEVTGRLEHPSIVLVYGLGQYADGHPFYAMRFIHGDNLREARKSDSVERTILDLAALKSTGTLPGHFGPSHRRSQISRQ